MPNDESHGVTLSDARWRVPAQVCSASWSFLGTGCLPAWRRPGSLRNREPPGAGWANPRRAEPPRASGWLLERDWDIGKVSLATGKQLAQTGCCNPPLQRMPPSPERGSAGAALGALSRGARRSRRRGRLAVRQVGETLLPNAASRQDGEAAGAFGILFGKGRTGRRFGGGGARRPRTP